MDAAGSGTAQCVCVAKFPTRPNFVRYGQVTISQQQAPNQNNGIWSMEYRLGIELGLLRKI